MCPWESSNDELRLELQAQKSVCLKIILGTLQKRYSLEVNSAWPSASKYRSLAKIKYTLCLCRNVLVRVVVVQFAITEITVKFSREERQIIPHNREIKLCKVQIELSRYLIEK